MDRISKIRTALMTPRECEYLFVAASSRLTKAIRGILVPWRGTLIPALAAGLMSARLLKLLENYTVLRADLTNASKVSFNDVWL